MHDQLTLTHTQNNQCILHYHQHPIGPNISSDRLCTYLIPSSEWRGWILQTSSVAILLHRLHVILINYSPCCICIARDVCPESDNFVRILCTTVYLRYTVVWLPVTRVNIAISPRRRVFITCGPGGPGLPGGPISRDASLPVYTDGGPGSPRKPLCPLSPFCPWTTFRSSQTTWRHADRHDGISLPEWHHWEYLPGVSTSTQVTCTPCNVIIINPLMTTVAIWVQL